MKEIKLYQEAVPNHETASYDDVMKYLGQLRKQYLYPMVQLQSVKKYYRWLAYTGQRDDDPAVSIRLRDQPSRDIQLQDLFTKDELEQVLERPERYELLERRNKLMLSFLVYQAMSTGEVSRLELSDIDAEKATVRVKASRRNNGRTLALRANQVFWLTGYLSEDRPQLLKQESKMLLISSRGHAETGEGVMYLVETRRKLFKGRKLNARTIRQSVIANLLKEGKELRVVQAFAGHKYPSTTEAYKEVRIETLKAQIIKYHPLQ